MDEEMNIPCKSESEPVQETEITKYIRNQGRVDETIHFLKMLGGSELLFNPYKDAILRLEGVHHGMRMADFAHDL